MGKAAKGYAGIVSGFSGGDQIGFPRSTRPPATHGVQRCTNVLAVHRWTATREAICTSRRVADRRGLLLRLRAEGWWAFPQPEPGGAQPSRGLAERNEPLTRCSNKPPREAGTIFSPRRLSCFWPRPVIAQFAQVASAGGRPGGPNGQTCRRPITCRGPRGAWSRASRVVLRRREPGFGRQPGTARCLGRASTATQNVLVAASDMVWLAAAFFAAQRMEPDQRFDGVGWHGRRLRKKMADIVLGFREGLVGGGRYHAICLLNGGSSKPRAKMIHGRRAVLRGGARSIAIGRARVSKQRIASTSCPRPGAAAWHPGSRSARPAVKLAQQPAQPQRPGGGVRAHYDAEIQAAARLGGPLANTLRRRRARGEPIVGTRVPPEPGRLARRRARAPG